jgi:hypothetical protein
MIYKRIPLADIRPLQAIGVSEDHLNQIGEIMDLGIYLEDVPVIEYHDPVAGAESLLLDGTHRAYHKYRTACFDIGALVLENDDDFRRVVDDEYIEECGSLTGFIDMYQNVWRPELERRGMRTLADLPVRPGSKWDLFSLFDDWT